MKPSEFNYTDDSMRIIVGRVMKAGIARNPFLRNFTSAIVTERQRTERIAERLLKDIFDPQSEVSYVLLGGLPGSGKTTFAEALADSIKELSWGMIRVERRSFTHYRNKAITQMQKTGEPWSKVRETALATEFMKKDALQIIKEGPRSKRGQRRVVIAEMPIYPVDEKERGMSVVQAIGEVQKGVPYDKRRARVCFVKPDLTVIRNAMVTRIMHMSSGGTPEMLSEIAHKAYAGAFLFRELQPQVYEALAKLIRSEFSPSITKGRRLGREASKIIALRMLAILHDSGLYGSLDTVIMNPARRHLKRRSRQVAQKSSE